MRTRFLGAVWLPALLCLAPAADAQQPWANPYNPYPGGVVWVFVQPQPQPQPAWPVAVLPPPAQAPVAPTLVRPVQYTVPAPAAPPVKQLPPVEAQPLPATPAPVAAVAPPPPPAAAPAPPVEPEQRAVDEILPVAALRTEALDPPPPPAKPELPPLGDCPGPNKWHFRAGASAYLLKPYYENSQAFVTTTGTRSDPAAAEQFSTQTTNFDPAFTVAPLTWVGVANDCGLGVRARHFYFEQDDNLATANNPATTFPGTGTTSSRTAIGLPRSLPDPRTSGAADPPFSFGGGSSLFSSPSTVLAFGGRDLLNFTSDLRLHTVDLELTREVTAGNLRLLFSGGGRYLHARQEFNGTLTNSALVNTDPALPTGVVSERQTVHFAQDFDGGGLTLGVEGRWRVGGTGVSLYGSARGSLLAGSVKRDFLTTQTVIDPANALGSDPFPPGGVLTASDPATEKANDVLPVTELELGVEYARTIRGLNVFVRGAAVDLTYFGLGGPTSTDGNLSLMGAQFSLGVGF